MADDEEWIEAELEKELLALDGAEDSDSSGEDGHDERHAEHQTEHALQASEEAALPGSFQELVQLFEEWGGSIEEDVEDSLRGARQLAEDVERELQVAPRLAWSLPGDSLDEDEQRTLSSIASRVLTKQPVNEEDLVVRDTAMPATAPKSEPDSFDDLVADTAEAVLESDSAEWSERLRQLEVEQQETERRLEDERLEKLRQLEIEQSEAERRLEQDLAYLQKMEQDQQEEQKRIEAERVGHIQQIEREQQESFARIQVEMLQKREEEQQYQEMMAMHSEEIRCQEVYEAELALQRQERRRFTLEDRCSASVRDEERRMQECAERRQECAERTTMAQEDALSLAVRRLEWERREAAHLAAEDARSRVFSQEMRRLEELRGLSLADEESWRWREQQSEAAETRLFSIEDARSAAARQLEREQAREREAFHMAAEDARSAVFTQETNRLEECQRFTAVDAESWKWRELESEQAERERLRLEDATSWMMRRAATGLSNPKGAVAVSEALAALLRGPMASGPESQRLSPSSRIGSLGQANRLFCSSSKASADPREEAASPPGRSSSSKSRPLCTSTVCRELQAGASLWNDKPLPDLRRPAMLQNCHAPTKIRDWTPVLREAQQEAAGDLAGVELGLDAAHPSDIVRLELRQERLTRIPDVSFAPNLRTLVVSGNQLAGPDALRPLQDCPNLEEVVLCQNSLTSLAGLEDLTKLSVLRATMNRLVDASAVCESKTLREVELSKNRLSEVKLHAPSLAKLVLYRNSLMSADFLKHLPSLTELDLGRNMLTSLNPAVSEWNPLLVKVYLYENHLASLPRLRLPLLTDLWLDNNKLESLGPLGFLPSLERVQAKDMRIRTLSAPIAASPNLKTLELAFNHLHPAEAAHVVPLHPRLERLQLNDNPLVEELRDTYRSWALQLAPQLLELDNEGVTEAERTSAIFARALSLAHTNQATLQRLDVGCQGCNPSSCECNMCSVGAWCEFLTASRNALSIPYSKEEKRRKTMVGSGVMFREEVLLVLRLRHDFWTSFLDLCWKQHASLSPWRCRLGLDSYTAEMGLLRQERSPRLRRVQARCRGMLARKLFFRLKTEQRCKRLTQEHHRALVALQARWRGWKARQRLRAAGVQLPRERRVQRFRQAATVLQAAFRGWSCRQKLRWARQMARVVDHGLAEVDVSDILGVNQDLDFASPFSELQLPVLPTPPSATQCAPGPLLQHQNHNRPSPVLDVPGEPVAAWSTPPPTAGPTGFGGNTPPSNQSARDSLRRSRSMSSTAESAITEAEGISRGPHRVEQAREEWGFQDAATAKAWLAAQKHRQRRPPAIPNQLRTSATCRGSGRGHPTGRGRGAVPGGSRSQERGSVLKAQDAIAAWRSHDDEQECPMEFQSGEPNLKLMRSSRGLQAQLSGSPRAQSPRKLAL